MLLERERELSLLRALADRAVAGRGALAWVEGQAGIGKSELLRELRGIAGDRMRTLTAWGAALERGYAFGVVRQLFCALGGPEELSLEGAASLAAAVLWPTGGDGASPEPTFAALHGLYWLVAQLAGQRPLLLVVDDGHLADDASGRFLCFLARRIAELSVLMVVSSRPPILGADDGALGELRRLAHGADGLALSLAPLSRRAVGDLLAAELGRAPDQETVRACHEASAGVPLHVRRLARELAAREPSAAAARVSRGGIDPTTIYGIVALGLQRCSSSAVALAHALSVLGERSGAAVACELAGLAPAQLPAALRELRDAEILDGGAAMRFCHPSIGEALAHQLSPGERERLHARAAQLLQAHGADPEQVAAHLLCCGPDPSGRSAELLLELGERALRAGAPAEARRYLEHALAGMPARRIVGRLRLALGCSLLALSDPLGAIAELDRATRARGPWSLRLRAAQLAAEARLGCGAELEGLDVLEAAIARAARADPTLLVSCRAYLAAAGRGLEAAAARSCELIEALRAQLAQTSEPLEALGVIAWDDAWRNRPADQVARLALRALAPGGTLAPASLYLPAVNALIYSERLAAAEQIIERLRTAAIEQGAPVAAAIAEAWRGYVRLRRGDLRGARAAVAQAEAAMSQLGLTLTRYLSLPLLIQIALAEGQLHEADLLLSMARERDRERDPGWSAQALEETARAELLLAQGDARAALRAACAASQRIGRLRISCANFAAWRTVAALAARALGDLERARELADAELAAARRFASPRSLGIALRTSALVAGESVDLDLLRRSVDVLRSSEDRLELARSLTQLGAAMRRSGARQQAREPLCEALELAVRCGAQGLRAQLRTELAAAGARPRRDIRTGTDALTPAERRVCELAAAGHSNTAIAQALFVSRRTVESQLQSAYRKLAIRSRRQLLDALLAGEQAPAPAASAFVHV